MFGGSRTMSLGSAGAKDLTPFHFLKLNPLKTSSHFYKCFSDRPETQLCPKAKALNFLHIAQCYIKASTSWACVQWYRALKWHRGRGEWEETAAEAGRCSVSPAHTWPQWLLVSSLQCIIPLPPCECKLHQSSRFFELLVRTLPPAETKFLYTFSRTAHRLRRRTTFGREFKASLGSTSTNQHSGRRSQQVLALSIYVTIQLLGWQVATLIASWQMWSSE